MAFNFDRYGNRDIYVPDAHGSNLTCLTASLPWDACPVWSLGGSMKL